MVGRRVLAPVMGVRALLPQPHQRRAAPSSRGPGHGPLKAETRVRIPLGPPRTTSPKLLQLLGVHARFWLLPWAPWNGQKRTEKPTNGHARGTGNGAETLPPKWSRRTLFE